MFFLLIGIHDKIKHVGDAPNFTCPACGALCCMHISVLYSSLQLFLLPVFRWNRRYLATAPCCGAVFELDPAEGRAFERGEESTIDPAFLHKASGFPDVCPACGARIPSGANYCFHCGKPLR